MHKHQPYQTDQQRLFLRSCLNTLYCTIIIRLHLWHKHFAEIASLQKKQTPKLCNTLACDAAVISDIYFMGFTRAGVKSGVFLCNQNLHLCWLVIHCYWCWFHVFMCMKTDHLYLFYYHLKLVGFILCAVHRVYRCFILTACCMTSWLFQPSVSKPDVMGKLWLRSPHAHWLMTCGWHVVSQWLVIVCGC